MVELVGLTMSHDLHVATLDSPLWPRVAPLVPRLRTCVKVRFRPQRDGIRALLVDQRTGHHHLVDPAAWHVLCQMDGERSLAQIWRTVQATTHGNGTPVEMPTQQELIDCLVALDSAGLLLCDEAPDIAAVIRGHEQATRQRQQAAAHPLAWRVPLPDPSRWLAPLAGIGAALMHPVTALGALALVVLALLQAGIHERELAALAAQRMGQPHFWLLAWALYPLVKGLHELGHALAVRHFGGEVRHVGIAFLYLMPAPYVDSSAASGFTSRGQRMAVSAVGVALELTLAAVGLIVVLAVQPGLLRDVALALTVVGGVSTVLANANPLVRMDGYHLLVDTLDLPNLATRSRRHGLALLQHLLLGPGAAAMPPKPVRLVERVLLPLYAPVSWAFMLVMGALAAIWMADLAPWPAAVVATLVIWSQLLAPAWRGLRWVLVDNAAVHRRARAIGLCSAAALLAALALFVPMPQTVTAYGIVMPVPESALRATWDGFARAVLQRDATMVSLDTPVLDLVDDRLPLELARVHAARVDSETQATALQLSDPARSRRAALEAERLLSEELLWTEIKARMRMTAPREGTLHWVQPNTLAGRWVRRGELLGHVLRADDPVTVRVAVPAAQWSEFDARVRVVRVRSPDLDAPVWRARWPGRAEAPTHHLPDAALGLAAGGWIETDPADSEGLRTLEPVVSMLLNVPGQTSRWLGQRVTVHFELEPAALAGRLVKAVQRTLLRHWGDSRNPSGAA